MTRNVSYIVQTHYSTLCQSVTWKLTKIGGAVSIELMEINCHEAGCHPVTLARDVHLMTIVLIQKFACKLVEREYGGLVL